MKKFFTPRLVLFTIVAVVLLVLLAVVGVEFFGGRWEVFKNQPDHGVYLAIAFAYGLVVLIVLSVIIWAFYSQSKNKKNESHTKKQLIDLTVRQANESDLPLLVDLYDHAIDDMEQHGNPARWVKGKHPSGEYISAAVNSGTFYCALHKGKIVGGFNLNEEPEGDYSLGRWKKALEKGQFSVIHSLVVAPELKRHKIASFMVGEAIKIAKAQGKKAIRLDVTLLNNAAMRLYEGFGFTSAGAFDLGRESVKIFQLYELDLEK